MAKLPANIDPVAVSNQTYVYTDGLELLEDIKRLRRKTGWKAVWRPDERKLIFHVVGENDESPDLEPFAHFEIKVRTLYASFWPSLYPQEPMIDQLRRWIFVKGGPDKVAAYLNETPQTSDLPEEASAWARLLNDDDL